ncbi:hypothetical protein SAY86_022527 [Trapa natans]|uniref:WRKY domain-containing protein n=1 Tax=Trapa natans TaxID=22666 RepID=A0AAN7R725_TRANT|nr:hypothetical protein SAY86_022527 [Trapa natans]
MIVCTKESSPGPEPNSQSIISYHAEVSTDEAPPSENKQISTDDGAHTSESDHGGAAPSDAPTKTSKGSEKDSSLVQLGNGGKNNFISSEVALLPSPEEAISLAPSQIGSAHSGKAEKASEDGYNWRKYGQKNVKGNEFIRSYYKCTRSDCLVKKQVERSLDGQITGTVYFGQHNHSKPQGSVPVAIGLVVSIVEETKEKPSLTGVEDKPSKVGSQACQQAKTKETALSPMVISRTDVKRPALLSPSSGLRNDVENHDDPGPKRKKKENHSVDAASVDKATSESRFTIQTRSNVDIVNDGYRWRKYGQKLVKGNPNPRSYYRCSSPGCPAKKHVERASHDPRVVMTTYESQHDHDIPAARTVTRNPTGIISPRVVQNDGAGTKPEEGTALSSDAPKREECFKDPSECPMQKTEESKNKCDVIRSSAPDLGSKSGEQLKGEPSSPCKSHSGNDSVLESRLIEEQSNDKMTVKLEESKGVCLDTVGIKPNELQEVMSSAAIQS